jgi:hypothetical protein
LKVDGNEKKKEKDKAEAQRAQRLSERLARK